MKYIIFTILLTLGIQANAQAISTASHDGLSAGFTGNFAFPDYSPQNAGGFGGYGYVPFADHFDMELDWNRVYIVEHSPAHETSFEVGPRWRFIDDKPFTPYFRTGVGVGIFRFAPPFIQHGETNEYIMAVGAFGLQYSYQSKFTVRTEVAYQRWFHGPNLENGLNPILYSVGLDYKFF